ncbi:protein kinase [Bacillus spongiae]|uniref:Protein kinase n=1 Tax=Bacillus spongiae TaxID=2683610 RepID=A0ABU8HJX4_9BACI
MTYLKSLTGIYYLGIGCGIWSKDEVIEWCDRVIEAIDHPPIELIETSIMSKSKIDDIQGKLFELSKIEDEEHFVKMVLSIIFYKIQKEQLSIERAIRITSRLLVQTGLSWENKYRILYSIDDEYDLALGGIIQYQINEVEQEYIKELGVFKEYITEFTETYHKVLKQTWIK